jgi:hypothetical protein
MIRRGMLGLVALAAAVAFLTPVGGGARPALAVPSATSDAAYDLLGRVFPDPQACIKGAPGSSPWAKGKVCATQFLQRDETLAGLRYLQGKFPRFAKLVNLHDLKATVPEFAGLDMQSAGLPQADLTRDRRDLYVFVLTDDQSPVPVADRQRYAFSLSIHGIERAGIEGGIRAAEDLVTWAATAPNTRILEPTNSGPTAGEVLRDNVLYFLLPNPDGWGRGEVTKGGVYYQRYNGNGMDLNRDFPAVGFANPVYTPYAEPETVAYSAYLLREKKLAKDRPFRGAGDLHGMNAADSFSYTLLSGTSESWRENHETIGTAEAIYRDAAKRLTYSPLIADPSDCPGRIPVFVLVSEGSAPMCPDQWGTVWDTINYQTTGSIGDWMGSKIGLGANGIDNEMAYSHLSSNIGFNPFIEQLHVDGNKGIIYAQIAALTNPTPAPPVNVAAGYAPSVQRRVRAASGAPATPPVAAQAPFSAQEVMGRGITFEVKGPADGVHNGGLVAEFTFLNVDGIAPGSLSTVALERFGREHVGDEEGWHEVGRWYRQEPTYMPAGARIDINNPAPGVYRLAPSPGRPGVTRMDVRFTTDKAVPQPNLPYDVANTDAFVGLGPNIRPVTPAAVLANPRVLDGLASYALADDPAPGVAEKDRAAWFAALKTYVTNGGTLVLTDHALHALVDLGILAKTALIDGVEYGGWISFTDTGNNATFGKSPLTNGLDRAGAASGSGAGLEMRRQTYDPGAVGYPISANSGANCLSSNSCHAPQTIVNVDAWKKAGGTIDGRAAVKPTPDAGAEPIGVAYGEVPLGRGRIRIAGGLLPTPTEAYTHQFGLEGFALSWTGWQVLVNLLSTGPTAQLQSAGPGITVIPRTGGSAAAPLDLAAVAISLVAIARLVRVRRQTRF